MTARIFQLNTSPGGVPKLPVLEAEVKTLGLVGDDHRFPNIHGGPDRAVCLFSLDRILELQAEGHPIFPGAVGENVTVAGLDWPQVIPGTRLLLGDAVIEITKYTNPCNTIGEYFTGEAFDRISQTKHPGWSRVYARVLKPGVLRVGAPVVFESSSTAQSRNRER
ncbi:MAG TPA: MOSC domain-containing protein [Pyrinomonadaceae bacterium]|nr:MOSC domain-containing protein [Pyrinomonadaceae bacterium]